MDKELDHESRRENLRHWSLERLRFLLAHIEGLIDDDEKDLKERARGFVAQRGLEKIESLVELDPGDPAVPTRLLERLSIFFDAGLLLQRGPAPENANWWTTDIFWRGQLFHLELSDQILANPLIPEAPPLQVCRAPAEKTLGLLDLKFISPGPEADAYLLKPTPTLAFVLISNWAAPWAMDHVTQAQRLVNKCFLY